MVRMGAHRNPVSVSAPSPARGLGTSFGERSLSSGALSPGPVQRLSLSDLRGTVIAPVVSPLPTVFALVRCALTDSAGSVPGFRRALLAHLRARDIAVLLPLRPREGIDGAHGRPNEIVPANAGASFDEELDAVLAVDADAFVNGIDVASAAGHPTGALRQVARDPVPWLRGYADALRRAWAVVEPIWSRATELMDRDIERVSVAVARGAGPELIGQLYPQSAVAGDDLLLPSHSSASGRVRVGDSLVLQPLLAPTQSAGWTDDYADLCLAVRYSIPSAWRAFEGELPPPASLDALVGPQRAKILRSLDRPATAGALAELLHGAPSMVSHHLRALETAGLISRTREGRNVCVRRSARGTQLAAMYERG
jgi:DNA-binding transcriptional ArsR family regulator